MAISKVSQYNSTPSVVADYQAQNAHLQAMINQANGSVGILTQASISTIPSIKQGTYISFGGVLYIVDTEDYTILGTAIAGDNYIRLEASGDNLTATWVQTITSYAWNSVYGYYTSGSYALLPYVIDYSTNYYISKYTQESQRLNTGYGANILYKNTYYNTSSSSGSDYTHTLSAMDVGEITTVYHAHTVDEFVGTKVVKIALPSGGMYHVIASRGSSGDLVSGMYAGGSYLYEAPVGEGNTVPYSGFIRRVS